MSDEAVLVTAALADRRRFSVIYDRYGDQIHDYCLSVLRHRDDAADAAQDTFLIAYERLGQLRNPARLTAWLYAIARSRCLRRIQDRKRQRPTDDLEPLALSATADTGKVERAELRQLVWDAAAGLAAEDRAVLDLHLRHGLSGSELADALGVSPGKASTMLHRMKQRMSRTIGAVLVARTGRRDCPELAAIAGGELTPLIRKRLARHIERCRVCLARRDRLTPELVYASMPLVPAPPALRDHLIELTASGASTDASSTLHWRADGFPQPPATRATLPVPRRAAVGTGVAALVVAGLFGGITIERTIGGEPAPAGVVEATPERSSTAAQRPDTATPTPPRGGGSPLPGSTAGADPTTSAAPTSLSEADDTPPEMSPLRLDCGATTVTGEVDVTDNADPEPTATLRLSWSPAAGMTHMIHAGGNTYRAAMKREGPSLGNVEFTASGTLTDASGNTITRTTKASCTPVVD